jgi:hypothetical protein
MWSPLGHIAGIRFIHKDEIHLDGLVIVQSVTRTPDARSLADNPAETIVKVRLIRKSAFRCDLTE